MQYFDKNPLFFCCFVQGDEPADVPGRPGDDDQRGDVHPADTRQSYRYIKIKAIDKVFKMKNRVLFTNRLS